MDVKELKILLDQYPDDMEVIYRLYSDYCKMCPDDIEIVKAAAKGCYVMRNHPKLGEEYKAGVREMLSSPCN